jgi:hypothetical protein
VRSASSCDEELDHAACVVAGIAVRTYAEIPDLGSLAEA